MQRSYSRWLTKLCAEIRKLSLYHFKVFLQAFKGVISPFKPEAVFDQFTGELIVLLFIFRFQQDHNHWLKYKTKRSPLSTVKFCPPFATPAGVVGKIWSIIIATHSSHVVALSTTSADAFNQFDAAQSILKRANGETLSTAHSRIHCTLYSTHSVHTQYVHTSINSINAIDSGQ